MTSVSRFLGVVIEGDTELEELCKKTPDSVWSKLANKLVPYVLDQGALERIVFLTGFTKLKTYTSDNIIPLLKNYTGEKARTTRVKKQPSHRYKSYRDTYKYMQIYKLIHT